MLYYEHAKSAQNRLKIWFVNTFVTSASENTSNSTAGSGSINDEWSSKGKWCGHLTSGWAGGALQTITSTTISSPPSAINDSSNHLGKASSDFSEVRNDASMVPKTLEQVEGMRYPAHRSKQPISSLIKATSLITNNRRPSKGPRRVQFANTGTMTVRYYNVLSPSCHLLTGADDSSVGNFENGNANNSAVLASESLSEVVKAARCNDHERLVVCLREVSVSLGQTGTDKDWLTRECHNAKYKCHEQVHRVLSVYKAAEAAISYAQAMKSWYAYHVQVEKIVGLRFPHEASSDHRLRSFSGKVYFFVNRNSKNYPSLPPMEISDVVDYGGGKTCALPEISPLHFNSALEDARVLLIHLHSVKKESNVFATIRVPMSEIHATCTTVGKAVAIEKEFSCKMGSKQGAKIFLKTTKRHVLPDYLSKLFFVL